MATQPDVSPGKRGRRRDGSPWRTWDRWQWPALLVITAVAAVADAWDVTSDGLEVYYAAGVRSMAGNWHAFLYDSFDPSRGITLDKLPGPFWVQALSVRAFGMSVWAMVLPQIVWSVLTVVVLFLAVRRVAGPVTGLTAAAILAISPVTILSAHGNLGDPLFVLLSVLAADAALRAVQGRGWWLALAAVWAGLAFQEKMAEAWLLAAVLAVVYLVAGPVGFRRRLAHPGYDGTILGEVTAATWQRFQTLGPEYNNGIPPGTWLAIYSSAAASNYVLAGVQRVLPIGGFTGSAPTPTVGQLTEMLSRHQIIMAIIPGPGDPRYNDPRVQAIVKHCGQVSGFGDTTAKAQLYTCPDA